MNSDTMAIGYDWVMANTADRAEFWKEFICTRCHFPNPERLRAQFAAATLFDFCGCGCNSFAVSVPVSAYIEPIAQRNSGNLIFEADFSLAEEGKTLEILLFTNESGNLGYVEIDCCANAYPVPDVIEVREPPYHVFAAEGLLR